MKMINTQIVAIGFAALLLALTPLASSEQYNVDNANDLSVHLQNEELKRLEDFDRQAKEGLDDEKVGPNIPENKEFSCDYDVNYYQVPHAGAYHKVIRVKEDGHRVKLEDGSVWKVRDKDINATKHWRFSDTLELADTVLIIQNSWYSDYTYRLINIVSGDYVEVKPAEASDDNGLYTYWITYIDPTNSLVKLSDGSWWDVYFLDYYTLSQWKEGNLIILGLNDAWNKSDQPHILINLGNVRSFNSKKVTHVRANFKYKS